MQEQETKDLQEMKEKIAARKIQAYDYMTYALTLDATGLKHSGHKTVENAVISGIKSAQKDIQKLTTEYLRKYPDE